MSKKIKPFSKLTAAHKRVAIAKDVILQSKAKRYEAHRGVYARLLNVEASFELNQKTAIGVEKCEVCAIGAACMSAIALGNQFSFSPMMDGFESKNEAYVGGYKSTEVVSKWFGKDQAYDMESAFEGWRFNFIYDYPVNQERLVAIFQNIIDNEGTFKPLKY